MRGEAGLATGAGRQSELCTCGSSGCERRGSSLPEQCVHSFCQAASCSLVHTMPAKLARPPAPPARAVALGRLHSAAVVSGLHGGEQRSGREQACSIDCKVGEVVWLVGATCNLDELDRPCAWAASLGALGERQLGDGQAKRLRSTRLPPGSSQDELRQTHRRRGSHRRLVDPCRDRVSTCSAHFDDRPSQAGPSLAATCAKCNNEAVVQSGRTSYCQ